MRRKTVWLALLLALTACSDDPQSGTDLAGDLADTGTAPDTSLPDGANDTHAPGDTADTDPPPDTTPADASADTGAPDDDDVTPPAPLLEVYALEGDDLFPESVTFDPVTRAFFTGSLAQGNVHRIAADGTQSVFFEGYPDQPEWLTLGVEVDAARRRLWVCGVYGTAMEAATIWVLDLDTAEVVTELALTTVVHDATCNDFAIAADGRAYVTDREGPRIYRVDADDGAMEIWATDPLLEPENVGLNGIALSEDGSVVLAGKYHPARIVRIPVADPTDLAVVDLGADDLSGVLSGIDGITMFDGHLYLTFELQLLRVTPDDPSWNTASVVAVDVTQDGMAVPGLSGVTDAEGALYVAKSDVVRFALGAAPELPFRLLRVEPSAFETAP